MGIVSTTDRLSQVIPEAQSGPELRGAVMDNLAMNHGFTDCVAHRVPGFRNGMDREGGVELNFKIVDDRVFVEVGVPLVHGGDDFFTPMVLGKTRFLKSTETIEACPNFGLNSLLKVVEDGERLLAFSSDNNVINEPWNRDEIVQVETQRAAINAALLGFVAGIPLEWSTIQELAQKVGDFFVQNGLNYQTIHQAQALVDQFLAGMTSDELASHHGSVGQLVMSSFLKMFMTAVAAGGVGAVAGTVKARVGLVVEDVKHAVADYREGL